VAALYEALLQDTIELGASLDGLQLAIAVTPPEATDYFRRISPPAPDCCPSPVPTSATAWIRR